MNQIKLNSVECDGWWEQDWYGRQPMEPLVMAFGNRRVQGSGCDIIGAFTFSGVLDEGGGVAMIKQYTGLHAVEYVGTYDGEGTWTGTWYIGGQSGSWTIHIRRLRSDAVVAAIQDFVPGPTADD